MAYFTNNNDYKYKTPYKMVAKFADGTEYYFYGQNETDCENSINDRVEVHGKVVYYHGVTDENYVDGKQIYHQGGTSNYAEIEEDTGGYFNNSYQEPKEHTISFAELYPHIENITLLDSWMSDNHAKLWKRQNGAYSVWDGKGKGQWKYSRNSAVKVAGCVFNDMIKDKFNEQNVKESGLEKLQNDFEVYIELGKDLNALDDDKEMQVREEWNEIINNL